MEAVGGGAGGKLPEILADKLFLSHPGGQIMLTKLLLAPTPQKVQTWLAHEIDLSPLDFKVFRRAWSL